MVKNLFAGLPVTFPDELIEVAGPHPRRQRLILGHPPILAPHPLPQGVG